MNKPDNVSDNPGLLPYGSNVGAPAIQVSNIEHWKEPRIVNVNHQFEDKFFELKREYEKLIEEYKWNELVYKSKFSFEPVVGKIYHLYYSSNEKIFLSLNNSILFIVLDNVYIKLVKNLLYIFNLSWKILN